MEQINLKLKFEQLLKFIYGRYNYHGATGFQTKSTWSKKLIKIIEAIEKAIETNIEFRDEDHKVRITNYCHDIKNDIKNGYDINNINHDVIYGLVRVLFEILGDQPNNYERKKTNNKNHWQLNKYRTIIYNQSFFQKANLIIHLCENSECSKGLPSRKELINKRYNEFNDDKKFVAWVKNNFPENYLKIFI